MNARSALLFAALLTITGCKSEKQTAQSPPPAQAGVAVTQTSWAPDALEELVAPIALYPDVLVGQILAASVSSQEVLDAGNWLLENQSLKGDAIDAASKDLGFGPATRALLHFPTVVDMMCQELDWTKQLGAAFTSDQKGVLDAIQRLRASAQDVGTLKSGKQMTVETTNDNGQSVVEIKPTDPKVVYVPQYDPAVVYTTPPATSTTTVIQEDNSDDAALAGLLGFGIGIAVGAAISNNYCYPHYGYGAVYMGPAPFYPPAYAYRPVYPAYRPAYGYHPPAGYGNNYHRGNTNITINNNYYNRFDNNKNLKGGNNRSPLNNDRGSANDRGGNRVASNDRATAGNRATNKGGAGSSSWKGKSGYAGAKPGGSKQVRDSQARVADNKAAARKPAGVDRGYGGSDRPSASTRPSVADNRASASSRVGSGSGGVRHSVDSNTGANVLKSSGATSRTGSSSVGSGGSGRSRDNAFSGAGDRSGSFDRAASARGNASTSSSSGGRARSGGGGGGGFRR